MDKNLQIWINQLKKINVQVDYECNNFDCQKEKENRIININFLWIKILSTIWWNISQF